MCSSVFIKKKNPTVLPMKTRHYRRLLLSGIHTHHAKRSKRQHSRKGNKNGGHSPMQKKENALFYMYMQTEIRE